MHKKDQEMLAHEVYVSEHVCNVGIQRSSDILLAANIWVWPVISRVNALVICIIKMHTSDSYQSVVLWNFAFQMKKLV